MKRAEDKLISMLFAVISGICSIMLYLSVLRKDPALIGVMGLLLFVSVSMMFANGDIFRYIVELMFPSHRGPISKHVKAIYHQKRRKSFKVIKGDKK